MTARGSTVHALLSDGVIYAITAPQQNEPILWEYVLDADASAKSIMMVLRNGWYSVGMVGYRPRLVDAKVTRIQITERALPVSSGLLSLVVGL